MAQPQTTTLKWLDSHYDALAHIKTTSDNICFTDVDLDGDNELVIGDIAENRLMVYKATSLFAQIPLLSTPCGVLSYYMGNKESGAPALAVAIESSVYIYRSLRPYRKFNVPAYPIPAPEAEIWSTSTDCVLLQERLSKYKEDLCASDKPVHERVMSWRTRKALACSTPQELQAVYDEFKSVPAFDVPLIVCMSSIKASPQRPHSMLVLGTEQGDIYIIDAYALNAIFNVKMSSTPVSISCTGYYDTTYRVVVACRDGALRYINNGKLSESVQHTGGNIISVISHDDTRAVCLTDKSVILQDGAKEWSAALTGPLALSSMFFDPKNAWISLVGCKTNELRAYYDGGYIDTITTKSNIIAMKHGSLGREPNVLVLVLENGALDYKILHRKSNVSVGTRPVPPGVLSVPRLGQLGNEEMVRERSSAIEMHQSFQRDLLRIRYLTATEYCNLLTNSAPTRSKENILSPANCKLVIDVLGIGNPSFLLTIKLTSTASTSANNITICTTTPGGAKADRPLVHLKTLVPSCEYCERVSITVDNVDKWISNHTVSVVVSEGDSVACSGVFEMPLSSAPQ